MFRAWNPWSKPIYGDGLSKYQLPFPPSEEYAFTEMLGYKIALSYRMVQVIEVGFFPETLLLPFSPVFRWIVFTQLLWNEVVLRITERCNHGLSVMTLPCLSSWSEDLTKVWFGITISRSSVPSHLTFQCSHHLLVWYFSYSKTFFLQPTTPYWIWTLHLVQFLLKSANLTDCLETTPHLQTLFAVRIGKTYLRFKITKGKKNSDCKGPQEISKWTSFSEQEQLWYQTRLLRALFSWILKTLIHRDHTTSLGNLLHSFSVIRANKFFL